MEAIEILLRNHTLARREELERKARLSENREEAEKAQAMIVAIDAYAEIKANK